MATEVKKLSFAKVAASAPKDKTTVAAARARVPPQSQPPQPALPAQLLPQNARQQTVAQREVVLTMTVKSTDIEIAGDERPVALIPTEATKPAAPRDPNLDAKPDRKPMPSLVINRASSAPSSEASAKTASSRPLDVTLQRGDSSSSELGTKPPSLDGKSVTSGTTFGLDEKESLRPDDSASVKAAAVDDDDAFSIRGSLIAGQSRMSSEVAARVQRIQLGDMPPSAMMSIQHLPLRPAPRQVEKPLAATSCPQSIGHAEIPMPSTTDTPVTFPNHVVYDLAPDDKLLEAMQSPKDRLFLLRLEKELIEFVQDSKEPLLDLKPCNSYCRMLTHKLADYYHMTHSFEAMQTAVRIYRTPFCRVPPPLSSIAPNQSTTSSPAPVVLPRKIMRRGEDGNALVGSNSPSKATSEADSEAKDNGVVTKEKMTREQREEAYKQARERIFGTDNPETSATSENGDSNGVSRASSVSAMDRSNLGRRGKPRHRRDDSDNFDSRSKYVAWPGPQHATWAPPQYIPIGSHPPPCNGPMQPPYANTMPPAMYGPPQSYGQMVPSHGYSQQYGQIPAYPAQPPPPCPQRFPPSNGTVPPYLPNFRNGPPQVWPQANAEPAPSYPPGRTNATGPAPRPVIPYAYGQLPANVDPKDPKSQHPIPGSYQRQGFNPKTQSFVPGAPLAPVQGPPAPFGGPVVPPHQGSPQLGSPLLHYHGYQPSPPPSMYGNNMPSYTGPRPGSNGSVLAYSNSPYQPGPPHHYAAPSPSPGPQHMMHGSHIPKDVPPHGPQSAPPFSTLANLSTPASLPPKPSS